jgi:hypothetical protein
VNQIPWRGRCRKLSQLSCGSISVQEQDVVDVDLPNRAVETIIVPAKTGCLGPASSLRGLAPSDPPVVFEVVGKLFPRPVDSVSVILEDAKIGDVPSIVRMLIRVLITRSGAQTQNRVGNAAIGTDVNHPIEVLQPSFQFS